MEPATFLSLALLICVVLALVFVLDYKHFNKHEKPFYDRCNAACLDCDNYRGGAQCFCVKDE